MGPIRLETTPVTSIATPMIAMWLVNIIETWLITHANATAHTARGWARKGTGLLAWLRPGRPRRPARMTGMSTYVAFLRAINLGARRKFPKDAIAAATEAAGFTGVATHINTGNVRLETRMRSRARIEAALEAAYLEDRGFEVPTIVYTCTELADLVDDAARLADGYDGPHYVSLLKDEPTAAAAAAMEALSTDRQRVHVVGRGVHLLFADGYGTATVSNTHVEKLIGVATNRNLTVLTALVRKWC